MAGKKKPVSSVHTNGGDFVGHDQNKVDVGNVSNSTLVIGKKNKVSVTHFTQADASLPNLIELVTEMRALLPQAKLEEDTAQVVEGNFQTIQTQLQKREPKKALVLPTLKQIAETLALAAATGETITKMKPMLDQAIAWAQTLLK